MHHSQASRPSPMPRNIYNTTLGGMGTSSYRGHPSLAPVAPYAFTSTPGLTSGGNSLRQSPTAPHLRQENRTSSAPVIPNNASVGSGAAPIRQRYPAAASVSTSSSSSSSTGPTSVTQTLSKDDSCLLNGSRNSEVPSRPASTINLVTTTPPLPSPSIVASVKPSPDRYRRVQRRPDGNSAITNIQQPGLHGGSAFPSGSGMATVGHLYQHPTQSTSSPSLSTYQSYRRSPSPLGRASATYSNTVQGGFVSVDDTSIQRQPTLEDIKKSRRRSLGSFDAGKNSSIVDDPNAQAHAISKTSPSIEVNHFHQDSKGTPLAMAPPHSNSSHSRNGSGDSTISTHSNSRPSSVCEPFQPWQYTLFTALVIAFY